MNRLDGWFSLSMTIDLPLLGKFERPRVVIACDDVWSPKVATTYTMDLDITRLADTLQSSLDRFSSFQLDISALPFPFAIEGADLSKLFAGIGSSFTLTKPLVEYFKLAAVTHQSTKDEVIARLKAEAGNSTIIDDTDTGDEDNGAAGPIEGINGSEDLPSSFDESSDPELLEELTSAPDVGFMEGFVALWNMDISHYYRQIDITDESTNEDLLPYLNEFFYASDTDNGTSIPFSFADEFGTITPTFEDFVYRLLRVPIGPFSPQGPYTLAAFRPASIAPKSLGRGIGILTTPPTTYSSKPIRVPALIELFTGVPTFRGLKLYWSARSAALDVQSHTESMFGFAPSFTPTLDGGWYPHDNAIRLDVDIQLGNGQGINHNIFCVLHLMYISSIAPNASYWVG
jgi:hypothetical protein